MVRVSCVLLLTAGALPVASGVVLFSKCERGAGMLAQTDKSGLESAEGKEAVSPHRHNSHLADMTYMSICNLSHVREQLEHACAHACQQMHRHAMLSSHPPTLHPHKPAYSPLQTASEDKASSTAKDSVASAEASTKDVEAVAAKAKGVRA